MDHLEHIDEFESMFRRAEREPFVFEELSISAVAIVTDGDGQEAQQLQQVVRQFLPRIDSVETWHVFSDDDYDNVTELVKRLGQQPLDLLVTRRHLQERALAPRHSLGVYLDEVTQRIDIPVLVLPGTAEVPVSLTSEACDRVMVVGDHVSGDNRLINYGVRMCSPGGTVWFCHVEDDVVFARYMQAIKQIPQIASDEAEVLIEAQLLKEAADFIETCVETLKETGPDVVLASHVGLGHHLKQYRQLIDDQQIQLLVANTKDDDQLAMHGMTYSLSIELVDMPLLLL